MKWMSFCQNPAIDQKSPEELGAKESHFICSQHFTELDYYVQRQSTNQVGAPRVRLMTSGVIPKTLGPSLLDDDGKSFISPIKPPSNQFAARMIGLKPLVPNDNDEDDDEDLNEDSWQYENDEETFNEAIAAFGDTKGS
jgi:hypothetical protein